MIACSPPKHTRLCGPQKNYQIACSPQKITRLCVPQQNFHLVYSYNFSHLTFPNNFFLLFPLPLPVYTSRVQISCYFHKYFYISCKNIIFFTYHIIILFPFSHIFRSPLFHTSCVVSAQILCATTIHLILCTQLLMTDQVALSNTCPLSEDVSVALGLHLLRMFFGTGPLHRILGTNTQLLSNVNCPNTHTCTPSRVQTRIGAAYYRFLCLTHAHSLWTSVQHLA